LIKYTYKLRLYPDNNQKEILNRYFGSVRYVYNYFLNQRKEYYLSNKKSINYVTQSSILTQLKKEEGKEWLKEINSQTLQYSLKCLEQSYDRFFKRIAEFPKFKQKKSKNSFTIPQNVSVKSNNLIIPKFTEGIKMDGHRTVEGLIKKCTISRTSTGKYFVSILVEKEYTPVKKTNKSIGVDLGLKDFLVLSNGLKIKNQKIIKQYERELKLNQQHLSRKVKGSNHYERQRIKVCKIHEKITNVRSNFIHKITKDLIYEYDKIYIEDLNVSGMLRNHKLAKSISDVSWSLFITTLKYKATWNDKQIVSIGRWFPSTKMCSCCGWIKQNISLNDREWICPSCNTKLDRDINAAKNILNEGLRLDKYLLEQQITSVE
jgi:putative transposase